MGFLAFISRSGPGLAGHSWPVKPEQERKSAEGLYIESSIEFFTASPQMSSLKMATFIPAKLVSFQAGTNISFSRIWISCLLDWYRGRVYEARSWLSRTFR